MSDLRVSVELGGTFPFPGERFGNVKPNLVIHGIDPEGDVDAQIELALVTGEKGWAAIDEQLVVVISNLIAPHVGQPGIPAQLKEMQAKLATNTENIKRMADHLRTLGPTIAADVKAKHAKA